MGWCIPNVCWWEFLLQIFSHISGFVDLWVVQESGFVRGWKLNLYKQHQFFSIIADEPPPPPQPSKHLEASEKISKWKKYSQLTFTLTMTGGIFHWTRGQGYNINKRREKSGEVAAKIGIEQKFGNVILINFPTDLNTIKSAWENNKNLKKYPASMLKDQHYHHLLWWNVSFQYIITFSELPFQYHCFGQEKPP